MVKNLEKRCNNKEKTRVVKVNLGSGQKVVPGWINYDVSINILLLKYRIIRRILFRTGLISRKQLAGWPKEVIRRNVTKGIPLPDCSVDYLYCSHMLEHLTRNDAGRVIREGYRVLKPGGHIRIIVPDLKVLAMKYVNNEITSETFINKLELVDKRSIIKRLLFPGRIHRWMYDYESLSRLLRACKFTNIVRRGFRKGVIPDIQILDGYPEFSLYVEAMK